MTHVRVDNNEFLVEDAAGLFSFSRQEDRKADYRRRFTEKSTGRVFYFSASTGKIAEFKAGGRLIPVTDRATLAKLNNAVQ